MAEFPTLIADAVRDRTCRGCSLFAIAEGEAHSHILPLIAKKMQERGFNDLEILGSGSYALVCGVKDNPDIVLRFIKSGADRRFIMPVMLQAIASEAIGDNGEYTIEYLKRMDMNVEQPKLGEFLNTVRGLGYGVDSLGGGKEIGKYSYIDNADGIKREVLMASDPSALNPRAMPLGQRPVPPNYPTLKDQYLENKRIALADKRLHFVLPDIEQKITTCVAPVVGGVDTMSSGGKSPIKR